MNDHSILADKVSECLYEGMSARETTDALLAAGVRPPLRVITTAAQADTLPFGTILLHTDCPDSGPCIWTRVCAPSEVEDEIDGGTFDHIPWTVWADQETRYDSEDLECHADHGGRLLAVYVPTGAKS